MTWQAWITLGIAVLGAGLGLLNSWNALKDRWVRMRVTPSWSLAPGFSGMSIGVVNLGTFPIVVTEVGFTVGPGRGALPKRVPIWPNGIVSGTQLPAKLDRRESASVVFSVAGLDGLDIRCAYAITSSGDIARGTSGALRQFIESGCKPI